MGDYLKHFSCFNCKSLSLENNKAITFNSAAIYNLKVKIVKMGWPMAYSHLEKRSHRAINIIAIC